MPVWQGLRYSTLYPGIDLDIRDVEGQLALVWTMKPGASIEQVRLKIDGADGATVGGVDRIFLHTTIGMVEMPPFVLSDGRLLRATLTDGSLQLQTTTDYLASTAIDSPNNTPIELESSTFLGGSLDDVARGIAIDSDGNEYVVGSSLSLDFPTTPGAFDVTANGNYDVFVAKLGSFGSRLVFGTYLGGNGDDYGRSIALDKSGAIYVTGTTISSTFPTTAGAYDATPNGSTDAFIVKLDSSGGSLVYGTYIGGSANERIQSIAVDATGAAYIVGDTESSNFPTSVGAYDRQYGGGSTAIGDAFVAKLSPSGSSLNYSTFLGGTGEDWGNSVAIDGNGSAYVVGWTGSGDFPVTAGNFGSAFAAGHDHR